MSFKAITNDQFQQLDLPFRCTSLWANQREEAWYCNATGEIVGVLTCDDNGRVWAYHVCVMSKNDDFGCVAIGRGDSRDAVGRTLQLVMRKYVIRLCGLPHRPVARQVQADVA
jgi:hypothetical protein